MRERFSYSKDLKFAYKVTPKMHLSSVSGFSASLGASVSFVEGGSLSSLLASPWRLAYEAIRHGGVFDTGRHFPCRKWIR